MPDASAPRFLRWSERQWRRLDAYDRWLRDQAIDVCITPAEYADLEPEARVHWPTLDDFRSQ